MLRACFGIPIMLRANACPEISLHDAAKGRAVGLLFKGKTLDPYEAIESLMSRAALEATAEPAWASRLLAEMSSDAGRLNAFGEILDSASSEQSKARRHAAVIEPKLLKDRYALPAVAAHALAMRKSRSLILPWITADPN